MILRASLRCSWRRILAIMALALACLPVHAQDFVPVPPLRAHVTDQVGMLTPAQRTALENVLTAYERRSGSQIALLLMASTAPEAIEQYSIRVADAWQLGRKGVDDGVILVVARDNPPALRRLRIEAGRGVQGSLTDAQSRRILEDVIAPHFRQNDFYGGLVAGVGAMTALLDEEGLPAAGSAGSAATAEEGSLLEFLLPLFFMAWIVVGSLRSRRRHYRMNRNSWGRYPGIVIGSGLGYGGYRGGGWGGGGFGGGGFRGGGGGFDGGGASGNW